MFFVQNKRLIFRKGICIKL